MSNTGYLLNDYIIGINENDINVEYGNEYNDEMIVNTSLREYLTNIKQEIDNCNEEWDKYKKVTNKYEFVNTHYINDSKNISACVCNYKPISRSYFKMIEILNNFDFNFTNHNFKSFHLAEGPGGFIESLYNYRKNKNDMYHGMTLIDKNKDVPKWGKISNFLKNKNNIFLLSGPKGDGNLYLRHNLDFILKHYNNQMDFITADGGFDYSVDFNKQEQNSINLIFCEVLYAIILQKEGGSFVLKIFDMFHKNTLEILYILNYFYEKIFIYKPNTSREANSEKYIVCINFTKKTNYSQVINKLIYNFKNLNIQKLNKIFNFNLNSLFLSKIQEINAIFGQQQIENIVNTINYIKEPSQSNKDKIERIKLSNIDKCIKWCQQYKQPVNNAFIEFTK